MEELEAGLDSVLGAPPDGGRLELIVRRPAEEERELLEHARLDTEAGLLGDMWSTRPSSKTGAPNPLAQVTMMNARATALVADSRAHDAWAPAGDQLYADFDISVANLPTGAGLRIGEALLEVTEEPHLGCGKFVRRFGVDAMKFVNSDRGRELRLRGVNLRVLEPGAIAVGDRVERVVP